MIRFLKLLIFIYCCVVSCAVQAENITYSKTDSLTFERYISQFKHQKEKSFSEILINTAKFFLGKPYVASTLEVSGNETLTINLEELDCTTFVENCIVLTRTIKSGDYSFGNYCRLLAQSRYTNGSINGYTSRLHYTSDWIYENEKKGHLKNISGDIGGKKVYHPVGFMSEHAQSYKHLKNSPENVQKMKEIEFLINKRDNFVIIPVDSISANAKNIKNGDIVAFATSIPGLDYSHIAIAYWKGGGLHFIHASSLQEKVVIEEKTLAAYCKDSKNCSGISILRLNN